MRIEPVSMNYGGGMSSSYRNLNSGMISPSFSDASVVSSIIDSVSIVKSKSNKTEISKVFDMLLEIYDNAIAQLTSPEEKIYDPGYLFNFLNYPNDKLLNLARSIVAPSDSNDEKALKITKWVHENLPYELDIDNYGVEELWAPPLLSLAKGSGDCEDGAFLVHSLMLHAGVPYEKLRTYGGIVKAGTGAQTGGHGWTAYKRERDNQWVVLDTSYYINDLPVNDRPLMKDDYRYIDDYFYFNEYYYVITDNINRVRDPDSTASSYSAYNWFGYGLYGNSKANIHINTTV